MRVLNRIYFVCLNCFCLIEVRDANNLSNPNQEGWPRSSIDNQKMGASKQLNFMKQNQIYLTSDLVFAGEKTLQALKKKEKEKRKNTN